MAIEVAFLKMEASKSLARLETHDALAGGLRSNHGFEMPGVRALPIR
jgi:hypothetical protein